MIPIQSVQRFVRKLKAAQPQRVWRMEALPGEEVQVDFGLGAPIWEGSGRPRKSWVFRMVLSYSRKAYSEAVLRQDTETFLRCLENGLHAFGGAPLLLNLDNLKAAVLNIDWKNGVLTIGRAKFQKSRLVPLHRSALQQLRTYIKRWNQFFAERPWRRPVNRVFVSTHGTPLTNIEVGVNFRMLACEIGIREMGSNRGAAYS